MRSPVVSHVVTTCIPQIYELLRCSFKFRCTRHINRRPCLTNGHAIGRWAVHNGSLGAATARPGSCLRTRLGIKLNGDFLGPAEARDGVAAISTRVSGHGGRRRDRRLVRSGMRHAAFRRQQVCHRQPHHSRRLWFGLVPWRSQSIEAQSVSVVRQSADTCKARRQDTQARCAADKKGDQDLILHGILRVDT